MTIDTRNAADARVAGMSVDASGSLIATIIGGDVLLWNAMAGTLVRKFDSGTGLGTCRYCGVSAMSLSPAGDLLAASGGDPTVLLFDTATGAVLRELETVGENTGLVAFIADGALLAAASTASDTYLPCVFGKRPPTRWWSSMRAP